MDKEYVIDQDDMDTFIPHEDGEPNKYLKEVIKVGDYIHPKTKQRISVTPDKIKEWKENFDVMQDKGMEVEIVADHEFKAEAIRGYITDAVVAPDEQSLWMVHEFNEIGKELPKNVKGSSVWVHDNYVDAYGNNIGSCILHNAVCQQPVIPGMSEFVALSRNGQLENIPVLKPNKGDHVMEDFMLSLHTHLGIDENEKLDEETLLSKVQAIVENQKTEEDVATLEASANHEAEKKELEDKVAALSAKASEKKPANEVDPDVLDQLVDGVASKLQSLAESLKITPAVQAQLSAILVGDNDTAPNTFMLSRSVSGTDRSIAAELLDIFAGNDVVELAEKTLAQDGVTLSRVEPGKEEEVEDSERLNRLLDDRVGAVLRKHPENK